MSMTEYVPDTRTIAATSVEVQRVTPEGGTAFTTGHVDISTTAATVVAAKETRKRVTIFNSMTCAVYLGPATVTTANGIRLDPGIAMDFFTTALIQGITAIAHTASGEDDKIHYCDFHD
jgi:hypothetical protein